MKGDLGVYVLPTPTPTPLPTNPSAISGTKIDRFMILRKLGEGGMGIVYAAYDARLERTIALKVLHGDRNDEDALARFAREAKGLAQISHPNVVQIHNVGSYVS